MTDSTEPTTWETIEDELDFRPHETDEYRVAKLADELGALVRRIRRDLSETQLRFGEAIGTSQSGVARLERGLNLPQLDTLERVAAAANQYLVVGIVSEVFVKDRFEDMVAIGNAVVITDPTALGQRNAEVKSGSAALLERTSELTGSSSALTEVKSELVAAFANLEALQSAMEQARSTLESAEELGSSS